MGVLFMVSPYTLRGAPLGPFKGEKMCICVCLGGSNSFPSWLRHTWDNLWSPNIHTILFQVTKTLHRARVCVCVCVCLWVSLCSVIFYSLKLLIPKSLAGMLCYFLMALTLCIVLIGTRLAADVQSAADCQRRGHSSVALAGKALTPCSWAEPTLSLYLTEYIAMEEIAEMPPRFPSTCST